MAERGPGGQSCEQRVLAGWLAHVDGSDDGLDDVPDELLAPKERTNGSKATAAKKPAQRPQARGQLKELPLSRLGLGLAGQAGGGEHVARAERARQRRNLVMAQMVKRGTLTQARAFKPSPSV